MDPKKGRLKTTKGVMLCEMVRFGTPFGDPFAWLFPALGGPFWDPVRGTLPAASSRPFGTLLAALGEHLWP